MGKQLHYQFRPRISEDRRYASRESVAIDCADLLVVAVRPKAHGDRDGFAHLRPVRNDGADLEKTCANVGAPIVLQGLNLAALEGLLRAVVRLSPCPLPHRCRGQQPNLTWSSYVIWALFQHECHDGKTLDHLF